MKKYAAAGLALALTFFASFGATAETFRYKFSDGDAYRINSVVHETVFVDRVLSHTAEITNRITVKVTDVKPATGDAPASARHDCTFMTSERTSNRSFAWGREYDSVFRRDEFGNYDIDAKYFMPVVRNVPTFPERDVKPGETWTGTGEEAHDLRDRFGIQEPFKVPFTVTYTYVGPVEKNGKKLQLIRAEYTLIFDTPAQALANAPVKPTDDPVSGDWPVTTMGYSKQELYWDNELGLIPYYSETFRIQLQLESGAVIEFRGTAEATVTETELIDRAKAVKDMNDAIAKMGITDTKAAATDEGITISLENIQFEADSARLLPSEKEKITKIAAILERYPNKELLISGHTALAGTPSSRQKLSEERADAVANFLVQMGVRSEYNVYTRGFGADKPVAPNDTEANKARNRRVEITILDK
jgi:outer membrane protein OmpA-like peptidoglycan-associated protein